MAAVSSRPPTRVGLVFPGGGPEGEYYRFERSTAGSVRVYFANSRVGVDANGHDHTPATLWETARIDWIVEAARRIRPLDLDALMWACTSGSFIRGREFAEEQASTLSSFMGIPASSTSLAFVAAIRHLGLKRVSVLATYPKAASQAFVDFLLQFGVVVDEVEWLDAPSGWEANLIPDDRLKSGTLRVATPRTDAVLIPDTALAALHLVEDLETSISRPVLTANAVTLWQAMNLGSARMSVPGFGSLLAASATA
jgi:maleate cis-trans isomerase